MKLNDKEKRMVSWLRGQHEYWWSTRIIILVCSIASVCLCFWMGWKGENFWHYFPLVILAIHGLSYTLGSWAGRPEISLLLKLIDKDDENGGL